MQYRHLDRTAVEHSGVELWQRESPAQSLLDFLASSQDLKLSRETPVHVLTGHPQRRHHQHPSVRRRRRCSRRQLHSAVLMRRSSTRTAEDGGTCAPADMGDRDVRGSRARNSGRRRRETWPSPVWHHTYRSRGSIRRSCEALTTRYSRMRAFGKASRCSNARKPQPRLPSCGANGPRNIVEFAAKAIKPATLWSHS